MSDEKKLYEFRRLGAQDILPMVKIINLVGVNQFRTCLTDFSAVAGSKDAEIEEIGISIVLKIANVIFIGYEKCEKELFAFLASVTGMKLKDLQRLDLAVFAEMIDEFLQKEEFADFIKVVSKSLSLVK